MAKKPKKPKKEKKAKAPGAEGDDAPKKGGMVGKLALVVIMGVTSFCTVFFLPRSKPAPVVVADADAHAAPVHEADLEPEKIATGFVDMESFTVSMKGRQNIMRIAVALEIPEEMVDMVDPNDAELRDAFLGYLSAIDVSQVGDAAFLVRLRAQLTRRARFVLGDDNVQNVLITDFLVR